LNAASQIQQSAITNHCGTQAGHSLRFIRELASIVFSNVLPDTPNSLKNIGFLVTLFFQDRAGCGRHFPLDRAA
jgi:hypothetical protein